MRLVLPLVALAAGAAGVYFGAGHPITSTPSPVAPAAVPLRADETVRLALQMEALQREVDALKSQAAGPQTESSARTHEAATPSRAQGANELSNTDAQRAAEAEQHRTYMAGVAQSFAAEDVDFKWAGYAASRLTASLAEDDVLRTTAHEVECRHETCRLQIDDDGSGRLSQRLTMMSLHLMDVFPTAAAEMVDQGNGHNALVLYMSGHPSAPPPGPAK